MCGNFRSKCFICMLIFKPRIFLTTSFDIIALILNNLLIMNIQLFTHWHKSILVDYIRSLLCSTSRVIKNKRNSRRARKRKVGRWLLRRLESTSDIVLGQICMKCFREKDRSFGRLTLKSANFNALYGNLSIVCSQIHGKYVLRT